MFCVIRFFDKGFSKDLLIEDLTDEGEEIIEKIITSVTKQIIEVYYFDDEDLEFYIEKRKTYLDTSRLVEEIVYEYWEEDSYLRYCVNSFESSWYKEKI